MIEEKSETKRTLRKFSVAEDALVINLVAMYGTSSWNTFISYFPGRTEKQLRDRYYNYLQPGISNGPWTRSDDELLIQKVCECGTKWKVISKFFPQRTHNNIKNRWYVHLKLKHTSRIENERQRQKEIIDIQKTYHDDKPVYLNQRQTLEQSCPMLIRQQDRTNGNKGKTEQNVVDIVCSEFVNDFSEKLNDELLWDGPIF